jgi:hypothetical protein
LRKVNPRNLTKQRLEWVFSSSELEQEPTNCLCGHVIKERCYITNKENGNELIVGNCCIRLFDESLEKIAKAIRKRKPNKELIELAKKDGVIREKDAKFLESIIMKRKLTSKQEKYKFDLERKIFQKYLRKSTV